MDVLDRADLRFLESLPGFLRLFPDNAACAAYLERSRWPDGFTCPHCGVLGDPFRFENRPGVLRCRACRKNTGLTVGTVMERSHTPLSVWFWASYLVASQTTGLSAVQFQRQLGLSRYETAFGILHKLRAAMVRPGQDRIGRHADLNLPLFSVSLSWAINIRFVVTSLKDGSPEHIYDTLYCARGQAENLIKLHKAQLKSDRTSCRSANANQMRLILHTAAYWLMWSVRQALPETTALRVAEFATIRLQLIKVAARVIETASRIRIALASACPDAALFRHVALALRTASP